VALVLLLAGGFAQARTLDQVPGYLKKEGNFVAVPAIAVSAVGFVAGSVVALPAALVAAPLGWMAGDPLGYAATPVSVFAAAGAEAGYHIGGAVPWVVKKSLYDAPMTGIARIRGEPASGLVAEVEPPPPENVYIQYLASTPEDARVPVTPLRTTSAALPPPQATSLMLLKRRISPFKPPPDAMSAAARAPAPVVPATAAAAPATVPAQAAAPARADAAPAAAAPRAETRVEADQDRPSLRPRKRKFSERFGF
jgi:hypothetical protein